MRCNDTLFQLIFYILITTPLILAGYWFCVNIDKRRQEIEKRYDEEYIFVCEKIKNGKVIESPNGNLYCKTN